ncbi:AAA family ATPase [Campylobacter sp. CN_NE4]|uniref:McrB family protein n=1 Tax=Campylobacter sp. CS_ED1 TaxID=2984140 RepID=UPI0022E9AB02|nr:MULTISPECIES: AAA family ATPase [unclassified Campylobacter]MDA3055804.1 AAA family ATPase [Campylobacter sp. CN_NA1]MDA3065910.1 AAA family ATPase [Campylobacter sp. CN_NE4]MDA3068660.1 AAA family ATPase [Campylobacter sp. CN_NE3]MDA3080332.1 AAA family ATPase [Campylobacter sp. CS_NA2]MDA3081803.1 AAA family ATPase [Campylobacter sp. CS_NA1]
MASDRELLKFTQEQREILKSAVSEFVRIIDNRKETDKTTGIPQQIEPIKENLKTKFDNIVVDIGVGSGKLSKTPNICFCRKDILQKYLVNTDNFTQKKGFYVILIYNHNDKKFYTMIGGAIANDIYCNAYNLLNQRDKKENFKGKRTAWYQKEFNEISDDMITELENLINIFNEFSVDDFRPIQNTNQNLKIQPNSENKGEKMKFPLNQILYGPPGTGKTYEVVNLALQILGESPSENRKAKFDKYRQNGQIEFITFHQSYGYEEFVEGIKPVFDDKNSQSGELKYEIKNGIFKEICERANSIQNLDKEKTLWRLYTLPNGEKENDYFDECIENKYVYTFKNYGYDELKNSAQNGHYIVIPTSTNGKSKTIRAFGIIENIIKEEKEKIYRKIKWLWYAKDTDSYIKFDEVNFGIKTFQQVKTNKNLIIEAIQRIKQEPYILIIDEINRGNISKIFGELITLIEESKRIKNPEELRVALPYSGKKFDNGKGFGVPKNLYIIGTMNTADRSIALIDTALRRRFEFVEMMPKAENLSENIDGVNLQKLLNAINERIEFLLDREHTIGHAYFIGVANLSDLRKAFKNKIIPLLQEYFYDDYEKIRAVLNDNGMITDKPKPKFNGEFSFIDDGKMVYQICKFDELNDEKFIEICKNIYE